MAIKKKFDFPFAGPWSDGNLSFLCLDTGSWRTARPAVDIAKCNYCGLCALYCPPQCMLNQGDHFEADLKYCKGCGICAAECPRGAITMAREE